MLARTRALSERPVFELDGIKKKLRSIRELSLEESKSLIMSFARAAKAAGLRPHIARDGADAARYIKRAARGCRYLLINNSSTVAGLAEYLEREGLSLIDTYETELGLAAGAGVLKPGDAVQHPPPSRSAQSGVDTWKPWEAAEPEPRVIWESFMAVPPCRPFYGTPLPLPEGRWAAAVGVSAVSASDASLFFVQHTHNISKLLFSAEKLFVVGGIERLVENREEALFQSRCAALFGLSALLEDGGAGQSALAPSHVSGGTGRGARETPHASGGSAQVSRTPPPSSDPAGEEPGAAEVLFQPSIPGEIHVVLIDGGRKSLLRSENRRILECIGCRACRRGCMMGGLGIVSPREFFLSELSRGPARPERSALYQCTLCDSCRSCCPLDIPLPDYALRLRERIGRKRWSPDVFRLQSERVLAAGNPFGEPQSARGQFYHSALGGGLPLGAHLGGGAPLLLYLGCVASFQRQRIVESAFRLLSASGREFSVLGKEELCCGYPLYAAGLGEFKEAARRCIQAIRSSGAKTVVTTCAGCNKTLSRIYPEHFEIEFETLHIVEYLARLVSEGCLELTTPPLKKAGGERGEPLVVAYHDPCDLGRAMGVYEPPRALLAAIPGIRPVEFRFSRQASRCCGAGGGAKGFDPVHSEEMALRRMLEAVDMGAELVTSACPACLANLQIVIPRVKRETGVALRFMDITELAARALGPG
ncbi:MAG: heterodisulfide reductase-related iron-sulfur binding cluster [Thermoplasmata archaeon]